MRNSSLTSPRTPALLAIALCALGALVAGWVLAGAGVADGAKGTVLGKPKGASGQQCRNETRNCQVIASVTAVQVRADGKRGVMKAPARGRIVAYGMDLGKPSKTGRANLAEAFPGGPFEGKATSQLAILRGGKKGQFKLIRKSPDFRAQKFMDRRPVVTLAQPLRVNKGDFVGMTTPSWLPALGGQGTDRWRASQNPNDRKDCGSSQVLNNSKPLRKKGGKRRFKCSYVDRVLYWAYFVRNSADGDGGDNNRAAARVLGDAPASAPSGSDLPSGGVSP